MMKLKFDNNRSESDLGPRSYSYPLMLKPLAGPTCRDLNMETRNQNSNLDVQEQQIKQLQSHVTKIKQPMTNDKTESAEFRKVMLVWMK
ncbi:hypothetical protein E3N88_00264 [Mikania micrantha]|uniref:Uncharacterized protein n=1 Tax=Mikania micrantha TaxID=192012 RepID=A0A5N6PZN2_9ASTR|nr:hypothetical protein E3N88_00264 [Mikania micrantha]